MLKIAGDSWEPCLHPVLIENSRLSPLTLAVVPEYIALSKTGGYIEDNVVFEYHLPPVRVIKESNPQHIVNYLSEVMT